MGDSNELCDESNVIMVVRNSVYSICRRGRSGGRTSRQGRRQCQSVRTLRGVNYHILSHLSSMWWMYPIVTRVSIVLSVTNRVAVSNMVQQFISYGFFGYHYVERTCKLNVVRKTFVRLRAPWRISENAASRISFSTQGRILVDVMCVVASCRVDWGQCGDVLYRTPSSCRSMMCVSKAHSSTRHEVNDLPRPNSIAGTTRPCRYIFDGVAFDILLNKSNSSGEGILIAI